MQLVGHITDFILFHAVTDQQINDWPAGCKSMRQNIDHESPHRIAMTHPKRSSAHPESDRDAVMLTAFRGPIAHLPPVEEPPPEHEPPPQSPPDNEPPDPPVEEPPIVADRRRRAGASP
jgi:hypothetical protein